MPADEVVATLRLTWNILAELRVPSALIGGMALAHWNYIRSTQDVDLLIALGGFRPQVLLGKLSAAGYRSKGRNPLIRLDDAEFIQLLYQPPGAVLDIQIDLLLADSPFHRQAVDRRVTLSDAVLGFQVDVVSCEDLLILKLMAGRIRDRLDAGELLKANREKLDLPYLCDWVRQRRLVQAFREAWNDVYPSEQAPV